MWPLWNGAVTRWMVEEHIDDDFIPVDSFESEQEAMDWMNEKGEVFGRFRYGVFEHNAISRKLARA